LQDGVSLHSSIHPIVIQCRPLAHSSNSIPITYWTSPSARDSQIIPQIKPFPLIDPIQQNHSPAPRNVDRLHRERLQITYLGRFLPYYSDLQYTIPHEFVLETTIFQSTDIIKLL
jgi:hypothetical protein